MEALRKVEEINELEICFRSSPEIKTQDTQNLSPAFQPMTEQQRRRRRRRSKSGFSSSAPTSMVKMG